MRMSCLINLPKEEVLETNVYNVHQAMSIRINLNFYYIIYFSIKLNPQNCQGFNFNSYSRVGLLNEVSGYGR